MSRYVLGFEEIDRARLAAVGGKGANLGELSKVTGVSVPDGFCVTTEAYRQVIDSTPEIGDLIGGLSGAAADDKERIAVASGLIREAILEAPMPDGLAAEIAERLRALGEGEAYAVRSSATAEDLPTASFAGQQDTFLNTLGVDAVLDAVARCWASLFNDRAVTYRVRNGFDHHRVELAVVVQRMVFPLVAGTMFTADPVTSNRLVTSIDASYGLGEALVSGLVNPDNFRVRGGAIVERVIRAKQTAVVPAPGGGVQAQTIEAERQDAPALSDEQVLRLDRLGRTIEAHFGRPQDIEWCLAETGISIVQSRPITTLFPIPLEDDGKNHVYMSFGHQQMMTDAMKPLGLSYFQLGLGDFPLTDAGGRMFIDLAHDLASPVGRPVALAATARIDPLIDSAIKELMKRKDFTKNLSPGKRAFALGSGYFTPALPVQFVKIYRANDPGVVDELVSKNDALIRDTEARIADLSGDELLDFILETQDELKEAAQSPRGMATIFVGVYAVSWINKHMEKWLGEKGTADVLSQSIANDVTSNMGLALLDLADVVRAHPDVLDHLDDLPDEHFFEELGGLEGGDDVARELRAFLDVYGMRCPGEIDITRPRWSEHPSQLVAMILGDIRNFAPNSRKALQDKARTTTEELEHSLLSRLEKMRGGRRKARKTRAMIRRLRNFAGYREYPKYLMMRHYWVMKQALLEEAARLVEGGVIPRKDDVYYLQFEELREAVRTRSVDYPLIERRRAAFEIDEKLSVPRVMTSEGEVLFGSYTGARVPSGALAGIAASSGTVEGRARVVLSLDDADLEEGDILVTAYTDPSWTPVFLSAAGLVTEVGGVATHGAVIAREYGLPAVVGVEGAARVIQDGRRVRVNGTEGYVEVLPLEP